MTTAAFDQDSFRGRAGDTVGVNSGTFDYSLNANWDQAADTTFRIRFLIQETGGGMDANKQIQLQYNLKGAGWNNVTTTSSVVKAVSSGQYSDNATTSQVLGSGTYVTGESLGGDVTGVTGNIDYAGNDEAEVEFCLQIVGGDVTGTDTIQLRCVDSGGSAFGAYTNTPTLTVPAAFVLNQQSYRFRYIKHDIMALNATTGWQAAVNTNPNVTVPVDTLIRIRYLLQETGGAGNADTLIRHQYKVNAGSWTNITGSSTAVQATNSAQYTDNATTSQVLGSGTYVTGESLGGDDSDGITGNVDFAGSDEAEVEFCIKVVAAGVNEADSIQFRCTNNGTALDTYTNTPTVIVSKPATSGAIVMEDIQAGGIGASASSFTVTAGPVVNSGDLLILTIANDGSSVVSENTTTDWTALTSHTVGPGSGQSYSSWYRIADGTEDSQTWTFDLTGGSETAAWNLRRFSGWHGTTPPEESTPATGSSTSPNPSSVTASWGADDNLFIAVTSCDETDPLTTNGDDYFNVIDSSDLGGSGPCIMGTATHYASTAAYDPAAFGGTFTGWQASTIVIRPGNTTDNLTANSITGATPVVDQGTIGQTHALTANSVDGATPTVDQATLNEVVALSANSITGATPTVDQATIGQQHNLAGDAITAGTPTVDQGTIGQTHALAADSIDGGTPVVDQATAGQAHALEANSITGATPTVDQATIGQEHNLSGDAIFSGTPAVDQSAIGQIHALAANALDGATPTVDQATIGQTHALTADDIAGSTPVVDQATAGQAHSLTADSITGGTPAVDQATIGQAHNLAADSITAGTPAVDQAAIGQTHALAADSITGGLPAVDQATIGQAHNLAADSITAGVPAVDQATLAEVGGINALTADSITSTAPIVDQGTLAGLHILVANNIITGTPAIAQANLGQIHALIAESIVINAPTVDQAILREGNTLAISATALSWRGATGQAGTGGTSTAAGTRGAQGAGGTYSGTGTKTQRQANGGNS